MSLYQTTSFSVLETQLVIISWKANRIKGYASVEDLELLLAYLKQGE